jgi:hypothetical protein
MVLAKGIQVKYFVTPFAQPASKGLSVGMRPTLPPALLPEHGFHPFDAILDQFPRSIAD